MASPLYLSLSMMTLIYVTCCCPPSLPFHLIFQSLPWLPTAHRTKSLRLSPNLKCLLPSNQLPSKHLMLKPNLTQNGPAPGSSLRPVPPPVPPPAGLLHRREGPSPSEATSLAPTAGGQCTTCTAPRGRLAVRVTDGIAPIPHRLKRDFSAAER